MNFLRVMIRNNLIKSRTASFCVTSLCDYFFFMAIFCRQIKFGQVKIVPDFSILLCWGLSRVLPEWKCKLNCQRVTLWHTINTLKASARLRLRVCFRNHSSIFDCMTVQYEGYDTYGKSVLIIWKYQVSFSIEISRKFCIFVWSTKKIGGGGKLLTIKIR